MENAKSQKTKTLLVVDDDPDCLDEIVEVLENIGLTSYKAEDGETAYYLSRGTTRHTF